MSTIRETVQQALSEEGFASYMDHPAAYAAVDTLEERESMVVANLIAYFTGTGLDTHETERILVNVGLLPAQTEAEDSLNLGGEESLADVARKIQAAYADLSNRVDTLFELARRNGIQV